MRSYVIAKLSGASNPVRPSHAIAIASVFREDYPWLYELGLGVYRIAKEGNLEETHAALDRMRRGFHMLERGPFLKGSEFDAEIFHIIEREFERLISRPPRMRLPDAEKPPRRKRKTTPPDESSSS